MRCCQRCIWTQMRHTGRRLRAGSAAGEVYQAPCGLLALQSHKRDQGLAGTAVLKTAAAVAAATEVILPAVMGRVLVTAAAAAVAVTHCPRMTAKEGRVARVTTATRMIAKVTMLTDRTVTATRTATNQAQPAAAAAAAARTVVTVGQIQVLGQVAGNCCGVCIRSCLGYQRLDPNSSSSSSSQRATLSRVQAKVLLALAAAWSLLLLQRHVHGSSRCLSRCRCRTP
jgi:hypothetical protein